MTRTIQWRYGGGEVTLGLDEAGYCASVVLLPALSSISTRQEMHPLLERLASRFHVTAVDWPGFGDLARPSPNWSPDMLSAFLDWFLTASVLPPHVVVAAGHAATYALHQAANRRGTIERLVLIAPTWRGPLPTMMGGERPWFARIRAAIDQPLIGPPLYRLNVSRFVISKMARGHVYSDPAWLTGDRLAAKLAVTQAEGARHSSVRFVTGALDRVDNRAAFLDLARRADIPILVIYGAETPPKSRAEIEALSGLPNVQVKQLPKGKLAVHEELPDVVADEILAMMSK
ncbi:alpha/beta hydrolase [Bradyrhizobium sp. Ai1a-2]|uniref:alpha/beta fold hydrolase n=1 Tax=Bradyrhizobium sp. Ai1a-2 TaxID=196490 RepID=UPI000685FD19|nr:alpha/beta hydrolase [Bradyrhizobium sp. Ai1a-2]